MSQVTRVYSGSLALAQLEAALAADEWVLGTLCALEARGADTIAAYDDAQPAPPAPLILGTAGQTPPAGAAWVVDGHAVVAGVALAVSVFRTAAEEDASLPEDAEAEDWAPPPEAPGEDDFGFITGPARPD